MGRDFFQLFPKKAVIGMLHLAGENRENRVKRALEEISIFEEEGLHGIIVEDYHGTEDDVINALEAIRNKGTKLIVGVNILVNPYASPGLADKYGARFVQFDTVQSPPIYLEWYERARKNHPNIVVLGGIQFKYQRKPGKTTEEDIAEGMSRCDAIVTTGEGTGIETPIEKLKDFRRIMGGFPLVVGAGVTADNAKEQMDVCDAAIMGSYFKRKNRTDKHPNTRGPVYRERVREIMEALRTQT